MNIFFLSLCPRTAAKYLCDKHVVKMILESTQLLCNQFDNAPYARTHANHPCSIWTGKSKGNFIWLLRHASALCQEYFKRYGKVHACVKKLQWVAENFHSLFFLKEEYSKPPQCMPEKYKHQKTTVAYKNYYIGEKLSFAKWKNGNVPRFVKQAAIN